MAYSFNDVVTKRQSRFFILSIIVSIILSLAAMVSYFSGFSNILTGLVNIVVYPINSCADYISEKITNTGKYFGDIAALKEENIRLKEENNSLKKDNAVTDALRAENEQLYSYLELKREYTKFELVNSKIISKGSGNFISTFTIDKGTVHGVKKNMPIITSRGIIGIVTEEGPLTSKGITLISRNSSVGVYLSESGATGILRGDYALSIEGKCKITGLSTDSEVQIGDSVLTNGLGEIYPRDLNVGTVTEIVKDSNSQTLTLIVTPSCDLVNEDMVMVITDYERTYEAPSENGNTKEQ